MSFSRGLSDFGKFISGAISGAARHAGETARDTITSVPPEHVRNVGAAVAAAIAAGYAESKGVKAPKKGK